MPACVCLTDRHGATPLCGAGVKYKYISAPPPLLQSSQHPHWPLLASTECTIGTVKNWTDVLGKPHINPPFLFFFNFCGGQYQISSCLTASEKRTEGQ